ncbi:MAG: 50S ribosomal protein L15 [Chlamydiae bacterium]|nr:50S ribosomal protein L15 [Chlamydiota bacterium]MBI3277750.1 50S ribosomal protein L15 [Chlamydiota bacterium]
MKLAEILSVNDSRKKMKRVGRGPGSGHGKTSCRGQKGQKARSGHGARIRPGFEGGQMPLYRRLPKRGFVSADKTEWSIVNVGQLNIFGEGTVVTPQLLESKGLVKNVRDGVKVLGEGELKIPLSLQVHAVSQSAREKIEKVKGKVELLSNK